MACRMAIRNADRDFEGIGDGGKGRATANGLIGERGSRERVIREEEMYRRYEKKNTKNASNKFQ